MQLTNTYNIIEKYKNYPWYGKLQLLQEKTALKEVEEEIKTYKPKIAVIGEFSTGKSTLINSLLQNDILPANFKPTTTFITEIKYSNENYILIDGEKKDVSKENLETINKIKSEKIELYLKSHILEQFTLVDTPGTNDPSKFTDDIVFSLVGESDVIIFVMNINQSLKDTEKQFISKLIREKDLDKFFFVLNWSDTVENPRIVKNETIDKLSSLLSLDKETIKTHTFLYSAKESLSNRLNHKEDLKYELFSESIKEFIKNRKEELLNVWIEQEEQRIINSIILKIEALEDKITGNTQKYENELSKIDEEIKKFDLSISKEMIQFEKDFNTIKNNYKTAVKNSIKYVYEEIKNEIDSMDFQQLIGSRYIELRVKKLLEDRIEEDTKVFLKEINTLVKQFDDDILNINNISANMNISSLSRADTSKKVVNVAALLATGVGAVSVAPTVGGAVVTSAGVAGISSISTLLGGIPLIGGIIATAATSAAVMVPVIGTFALAAGKVLFDVGKWGVGKLGDMAVIAEEKAKKIAYLKQIEKSLKKIESQIVSQIDKININDFRENYIKSKFPQKSILEEKIKIIESKQIETIQIAQEEMLVLEKFKSELLSA